MVFKHEFSTYLAAMSYFMVVIQSESKKLEKGFHKNQ